MKVSILIIAHNEEENIAACLAAVLDQSIQPDEIVVVAHNCTDRTEEIVRSFESVRLVSYHGSVGSVYARIRGFEEVSGDIVACLDGDAVPVGRHWLRNIAAPFADKNIVAVGGEVVLANNLYTRLIAKSVFQVSRRWRSSYHFYFWGANFACRRVAYLKTGGLYPLVALAKKLQLHYLPDDLYLSVQLEKIGQVIFVPMALVRTKIPYKNLQTVRQRFRRHGEDTQKLFHYFEIG